MGALPLTGPQGKRHRARRRRTDTPRPVRPGGARPGAPAVAQAPWHIPRNAGRPTEPLRPDAVARLHDATMRILEEIGNEFLRPDTVKILRDAGMHARHADDRPDGAPLRLADALFGRLHRQRARRSGDVGNGACAPGGGPVGHAFGLPRGLPRGGPARRQRPHRSRCHVAPGSTGARPLRFILAKIPLTPSSGGARPKGGGTGARWPRPARNSAQLHILCAC